MPELERKAQLADGLRLDLSNAPPEYQDLGMALARRITGEAVPSITLPHRLLAGGTLARAPAEASLSVVSSLTSDTQGASR